MKVKYLYEYIKNNSEIRPPMNFVFVVMARGLFRNWKQPIYFNYDCPPTKKLILSLIALMKIKLKKCYESLNSQRESIRFLKNHFLIEILKLLNFFWFLTDF